MKTKRIKSFFGFDPEVQKAERQALVQRANIKHSRGEINFEELLLRIHQFIFMNFQWDNSPLRHLRIRFPDFIWEYCNLNAEPVPDTTVGIAVRAFYGADYTWTVLDDNFLFKAWKKKRTGEKLIVVGWNWPWWLEAIDSISRISLREKRGIEGVYITNKDFTLIYKRLGPQVTIDERLKYVPCVIRLVEDHPISKCQNVIGPFPHEEAEKWLANKGFLPFCPGLWVQPKGKNYTMKYWGNFIPLSSTKAWIEIIQNPDEIELQVTDKQSP
ncbi:MAG: hypothetical protein WC648_02855 [Candidatus Paceibacterota bacterium]|jgi:hypothetical protein